MNESRRERFIRLLKSKSDLDVVEITHDAVRELIEVLEQPERIKRRWSMSKAKLKPCPFCGKLPFIQLTDDEGNHRPQSYLDDPYSGVGYVICHPRMGDDDDCPIATCDVSESLGSWMWDTEEEAAEAWNRRRINEA